MYSLVNSASVFGVNAFIVQIETHLDSALPRFDVVGLPDSAVKEARERVSAAIKNSDFIFPAKKITVNLAPADRRKEGSAFDLPIAIGLLVSTGMLEQAKTDGTIFLGELSLDGSIRPIKGALPIALHTAKEKFNRIILPEQNANEAALISDIEVIPVTTLKQTVEFLNQEQHIEPRTVNVEDLFNQGLSNSHIDISDVKGQETVKRALEIAAAGGHNLIMVGPPGSGKTMLAKRIPTILPPLSLKEALETTKIHSVAGILPHGQALVCHRPFRSPHHTISDAALVGGGMNVIRAGEISLSHHGVLFLDELPEFARNVLEVLRQPLEDKRITISRTKLTVEYPANFILVCSMNPCPCGNYGNPNQECHCTPPQIQRYMSKVSGPLMDRIDIHLEVPAVKYAELSSNRTGETSAAVRARVINARLRQTERFKEHPHIFKNADMGSKEIRKFCPIGEDSQTLMKTAMTKLGFSARAYDKILKVACTIADLEGKDKIESAHIAEAIQYRNLDRQYFK